MSLILSWCESPSSARCRRSGSFRAWRPGPPRAPLNASVSAHPLLPLPPGSDAISLEWDKQPHYLEASLMMKGYSAEEARAAAQRARSPTRSPPRTPPRRRSPPPLAATAFATTRDKVSTTLPPSLSLLTALRLFEITQKHYFAGEFMESDGSRKCPRARSHSAASWAAPATRSEPRVFATHAHTHPHIHAHTHAHAHCHAPCRHRANP
ncbi:uncharacterized protein LOC123723534 [Papilio machaon]|uniref:uncharacterized protein LOC123723534 n=1 Tax=Papilio machaon TaxID=76193 RepID=UPI001E665549|nr:uncharacterized protein LOC123723534 [Papilio machaon]